MLTVFLHPHSSQRVRHGPRGWDMLPLVWGLGGEGLPLTGMPTIWVLLAMFKCEGDPESMARMSLVPTHP